MRPLPKIGFILLPFKLLAVSFIVLGLFFSFLGIRDIVRANASIDWPSAPGRVLDISVNSDFSRTGNHGSSTSYQAEVLYEFSVDGASIRGSRVAYGEFGGSQNRARRRENRYPIGKNVTVYYMPNNPKESLLEPGMKWQVWIFLGVGLIFFIIGRLSAKFFFFKTLNNHISKL